MISKSPIKNAVGAAKYMTEQAATEYYAGQAVPSEWLGKGAELQGLAGEVTSEELTNQLLGNVKELDKDSGELVDKHLFKMKDGEQNHRAGWDFTFAPPKSVSIESEVFGKLDVRAAHEEAVKVAMNFLEEKGAQARINGERVNTKNLTYSIFQHATTREGDPHSHTHVLIANVTYDANGKAYSLESKGIHNLRTAADAVYINHLANALDRMGYKLQFDKEGHFEIVGYTKEQLAVFSKRTEQIKDELAKQGLNKDTASGGARQVATLETRQAKDHPENAEAHRGKWMAEAEAAGIKQAEREPMGRGYAQQGDALKAVEMAIDHLMEREMAFKEKDLWREAAKFSQGRADTHQLIKTINELMESGKLVERTDGKFTTQNAMNAEKEMGKHLAAGHGAHDAVMTEKEFYVVLQKYEAHTEKEFRGGLEERLAGAVKSGDANSIVKAEAKLNEFNAKGFALNPEQRNFAKMILTGDDRFQGVQGLAGTGKTTVLKFIREAAESKGWEVRGFSNGGAQADKMQAESGIQSSTTARFNIEFQKMERDGLLAQRALATFEKYGGLMLAEANFKRLWADVKSGRATVEYGSKGADGSPGRAFITTANGDTFTKGLFEKVSEFQSPNLNHLGLTSSKYVIHENGDVFKQGGSLLNEAASNFMDKVKDSTRDAGLLGKGAAVVADKTIGLADKWIKCGILEASTVKASAFSQTVEGRREELKVLEQHASEINGETRKVLNICDEASMSGQREFNHVIDATEKTGARTVFLGDKMQHQSVDAGKAFEHAQSHMSTAMLGAESITRQQTQNAKEMVADVLMGRHGEALSNLPCREVRTNQDEVLAKYAGMEKLTPEQKEKRKAELAEAAKADNKEVIKTLAKDYASMEKGDRDKTLVITSTNSDKNSLNTEIRSEMKARGELQDGKQISTYEKADISKQQANLAANYEKGQVIEFTSKNSLLGLEKGQHASVEKTDSFTNTVTARTEDGRLINFNPEKLQGKEVYNEYKEKEFAVGDRMTFTKNDKNLDVKNGQTGTVEKFDGKNMTVKMDNGDKREINTQDYKHIDHAYAVTSYKSQGQTVDRVLNHHNTMEKGGQHGDRETYVNLTRAREDVTVYTQNIEKATLQSGVKLDKEVANIKEATRPEQSKSQEVERASEAKTERTVEAKPEQVKDASPSSEAKVERVAESKPEQFKETPVAESKAEQTKEAESKPDHAQQISQALNTEQEGKMDGAVKESDIRIPRDAELAQAALDTTERLGSGFEHAPNFEHLRDAVLAGADYVSMERDSGGREFFFKDGETFTRDAYGSQQTALVEQAASRDGEAAPRTEAEAILRDGKLASDAIDTANHRSEMHQGQPNFESLERGLKDGSVTLSTDSTGREFYHQDGETFTRDAYGGTQQYHELLDQAHKGIDLELSNKAEQSKESPVAEAKAEQSKETTVAEAKAEPSKEAEAKSETKLEQAKEASPTTESKSERVAEAKPEQAKDSPVAEAKPERAAAEINPWGTIKDVSPTVDAKPERSTESKAELSKPETKQEQDKAEVKDKDSATEKSDAKTDAQSKVEKKAEGKGEENGDSKSNDKTKPSAVRTRDWDRGR